MPKKPNQRWGHVAFGKDGSVTKHDFALSDNKQTQETEVIAAFSDHLRSLGQQVKIDRLPEDDHDFKLSIDDTEVIVQITEAAPIEYLSKISREEYDSKTPRFVYQTGDGIFAVDETAQNTILLKKLLSKQAKRYQQPKKAELWLCIFTADTMLTPVVHRGGKRIESAAWAELKCHCQSHGASPFTEIWLVSLGYRAYRLWPADQE